MSSPVVSVPNKIVLKHFGRGKWAGKTQEFDQLPLRIGRRPDNDVVYDPRLDILVSGHHAELRLVSDALVLVDLGSKNGTFVNGTRISSPVTLGPNDRVQLGPDGPEFEVTRSSPAPVASAPSPPAAPAPASAPPPAPSAAASEAPTPPPQPVAPKSREFPSVTLAGSRPPQRVAPADDVTIRPDTDDQPPPPPRQTIAAGSRTRRRTALLVIVVAALAAATFFAKQLLERAANQPPSFTEALARTGPSVYAVVLRENKGGAVVERAQGTAWSAAPGYLATNAHVASLFSSLAPGQSLIARSNSKEPQDLAITEVRLHPGYADFDELVGRFVPFDTQRDEFVYNTSQLARVDTANVMLTPGRPLISPCDVALLVIASADVEKQAPALPLAEDAVLASLQNGEPIAYVGFPGEDLVRGGGDIERPEAFNKTGTLSKTTDFLLSRPQSFDDAVCMAFELDIAGGASGSPVLHRSGKVLGMIAAGDFHFGPDGSRVPILRSGYGPRIDLVAELLDGSVTSAHAKRLERWRHSIEQMFTKGTTSSAWIAERVALSLLTARAAEESPDSAISPAVKTVEALQEWSYFLTATNANATGERIFRAPAAGRYVICAIAKTKPISIALEITTGKNPFERRDLDLIPRYVECTTVDATAAGEEFTIRAITEQQGEDAASEVAFFVLRAKP